MWYGGFIGGHLASKFILDEKIKLICADIKPLNIGFKLLKTPTTIV